MSSMYSRMSERRLDHMEELWWWIVLSNELALENALAEGEAENE